MLRAIVRLSARAMTRALEWVLPPQEDDESRLRALVVVNRSTTMTDTDTPTSTASSTRAPSEEAGPTQSSASHVSLPTGLRSCHLCATPQRPGAVHFAKPTDERPCPGSWRR